MKKGAYVLGLALFLSASQAHAQSWTAPTSTPPTGNIASPINVGTVAQVKNGGLSVNAFTAYLNSYFAGNVGIGAAPSVALEVYNGVTKLWHGSTAGYTSFQNGNEINYYNNGNTAATLYLQYRGGDTNIGANAVTVKGSGGNVGIATTSPLTALAVGGTITTTGGVKFADGTTLTSAAGASQWTTSGSNIYNSNAGNVGVGNTGPSYKLDVTGTGRFTGNLTASAGITLSAQNQALALGQQGRITGSYGAFQNVDSGSDKYAMLWNAVYDWSSAAYAFQNTNGQGAAALVLGNDRQLNLRYKAGPATAGSTFTWDSTPFTINSSGNMSVAGTGTFGSNAVINGGGVSYFNGGYVGIGNSTPNDKLEVASGNIFVNGTTGNGIKVGANNGMFMRTNVNSLAIDTNSSERMRIDAAGNVGIGNTAPNTILHVGPGADAPISGTASTRMIYASANGQTDVVVRDSTNDVESHMTSWSGGLDFGTVTNHPISIISNNSQRIAITAAGNVGISTSTPLTTLAVGGTITTTGGIKFGDGTVQTTASSASAPTLQAVTNSGNTTTNGITVQTLTIGKGPGTQLANTALGAYALNANTTGNSNTAVGYSTLYNNTSGSINTAIGPSALTANIDGSSNTAIAQNALQSNTSGGQNTAVGVNAMYTNTTGTGNTAIGYQANVASGALTNATAIGYTASVSASNALILGNSSVSVGVGVTAPGYKLEVNGSVGAASFFYTSDRSLKKNIQPLNDSLAKIQKLQGVSFNWKKDDSASVGLIAQDVEKVYPELVNTNKVTGLKSVEYANLVAPLIEAVKEQQKTIEGQEQRIQALEKKLELLTR